MKNILTSIAILLAACVAALAQNTVTFDNQSGEPALVKLIGPTQPEVEVANGAKVGTDAASGRYYIKVRYGTAGKYHYAKGEEFEIKETETTRSEITITLHKVVAGNYDSHPISATEFAEVEKSVSSPPASSATTTGRDWQRILIEGKIFSKEHLNRFKLGYQSLALAFGAANDFKLLGNGGETVGSTAEQLVNLYGKPDKITKDDSHTVFHYGPLGILCVGNNRDIVGVLVLRNSQEQVRDAIETAIKGK